MKTSKFSFGGLVFSALTRIIIVVFTLPILFLSPASPRSPTSPCLPRGRLREPSSKALGSVASTGRPSRNRRDLCHRAVAHRRPWCVAAPVAPVKASGAFACAKVLPVARGIVQDTLGDLEV